MNTENKFLMDIPFPKTFLDLHLDYYYLSYILYYYMIGHNAEISRGNIEKETDEIKKQLKKLMRIIFNEDELIAGSYIETHIRCGNRNCHCQKEGGHYATKISHWINGKLKTIIVNVADRGWVRNATSKFKKNKKTLQEIVRLHTREKELIKLMIELKTKKYK